VYLGTSRSGLRRAGLRRAGLAVASALVIVGVAMVGGAGPASAAPAPPPALTLDVTVAYDRTMYAVGDTLTLTTQVTNSGAATATDVKAVVSANHLAFSTDPNATPAFELAPGATRTFAFTGVVEADAADTGRALGLVRFGTTNEFGFAYARVAAGTATVTGRAHQTTDGAVRPTDPGLPGVTVTLTDDLAPEVTFTAVTGADGRYVLDNVPVSVYNVSYAAPAGWRIPPRAGLKLGVRRTDTPDHKFAAIPTGEAPPVRPA